MKISSRARHAVRLMLEIARMSDGKTPVQLTEVSNLTGLSRRFLEQLTIALKSHSLLQGVCGRSGGYLLARPSSEISVGNVFVAVTGPVNLANCANSPETCEGSDLCESRLVWALLQQRMKSVLDDCTIADLLNAKWKKTIQEELGLEPSVRA